MLSYSRGDLKEVCSFIMHHLPEQTKQGLKEKPQVFIDIHQHTNKCTDSNHKNKELATHETFLSAFQRCGVLLYTSSGLFQSTV